MKLILGLLVATAFAGYKANSELAEVKGGVVRRVIVCYGAPCQRRYKAKGWVPAPLKVGPGWKWNGKAFTAPVKKASKATAVAVSTATAKAK